MRLQRWAIGLWMCAFVAAASAADPPAEVAFPSLDGKTTLRAYLFRPTGPGPWPAVVMMHGRAGPYAAALTWALCVFGFIFVRSIDVFLSRTHT